MVEHNLLSPEAGEDALSEEIALAAVKPRETVFGWYIDAALEEAERILKVTPDDLLAGGYYIETALSPSLQTIAEELFANRNNFPANASDGTLAQGALSVVDVKTGAIIALVGGRDYSVQRGFNRAIHMRRSPGSAIKPLAVYAPAIEKGYTTASILLDERTDFGGGYNPRNSGNRYYGPVTARRALALSLNVATVRLMKEIGVGTSMNFLQRAGITLTDTDANLSLALGAMTMGVTPTELAASYAMFGNQGIYNAPHIITRINGPDGSLLYEHRSDPRTVMSKQNNYLMVNMMQSVTGWGTGAKLSATGLAVAGKTGTNSLTGIAGNHQRLRAGLLDGV
jgi:membrane peptidoglycan carboxypeptidase